MRKKGVVLVALLIISIITLFVNLSLLESHVDTDFHNYELLESNHPYILIVGNNGFNTYSFPGNGSSSNPYLIKDLIIEADGFTGIFISDTSVHFIIRNCTILSTNFGLAFEEVEGLNSQIYNNTFWSENYEGIFTYHVNNLTFYQNTVKYSSKGFRLSSSHNITIADNIIQENRLHGVELTSFAHNISIYGNSFLGNNINGDSQGRDDSQDSNWANLVSHTGNLWSDYDHSGPYELDGTAYNVDLYPQYVAYTVTGIPDFPISDETSQPTGTTTSNGNGGTKIDWGEIGFSLLIYGAYPGSLFFVIVLVAIKKRKTNIRFWKNVRYLGIPLEPKNKRIKQAVDKNFNLLSNCLLYTSPSPRD